nr:10162_t:CDS:1 [Entrophospora candida]
MGEGWAAELGKRNQLPGETVDAFATHIYELFRRIEHGGNNYPERVKARMFIERLRPELSMAVSPFLPDTIQDAIERTKAYEMTYSRGGTLSAYSAEQFMPSIIQEVINHCKG